MHYVSRIPFYFLISFSVLFIGVAHSEIRIHSHTFSPAEITVGDFVNLHLHIEADENLQIDFALLDTSQLQHIEAGTPQAKRVKAYKIGLQPSAKGNVFYEVIYPFQVFAPGKHVLPPIGIKYIATNGNEAFIQTPTYSFKVQATMPENAQRIRDIKPPMAPRRRLGIYILALVLIITMTCATIFLYLRKRTKMAPLPIEVPRRPLPHEIAHEQLKEIEEKNLVSEGKLKAYHTELSQVVREYIDARYKIPALELTTDDLLECLNNADMSEADFHVIQNFLTNCNLVKFAKYKPSQPEAHERMAEAHRFIEATKGRE